jgi:hypothetical protein
MFPRRSLSVALLALLGVAGTAPGVAAAHRSAAALKVFSSAHFGYTLSYPAAWHRTPASSVDFLVLAPDSLARLASKGIDASLSTADLRKTVAATISDLGVPIVKIERTTRVIHGVPFQLEQATLKVQGITMLAMTLGTSQHRRTYLFFGIVGLGKPATHLQAPHAREELGQIQASFASITIAR